MTSRSKTADLARLLHQECQSLLELYTEKESMPSFPVSGAQLVTAPDLTPQLSYSEKLACLHTALQMCRLFLEEAIARQVAEYSESLGDEYRTLCRTVQDRLGHLVLSTEYLLPEDKRCTVTVPKVPDSVDSEAFALKMFILQVLQDLVHWTKTMADTLQSFKRETRKSVTRTNMRMRSRMSRDKRWQQKGQHK